MMQPLSGNQPTITDVDVHFRAEVWIRVIRKFNDPQANIIKRGSELLVISGNETHEVFSNQVFQSLVRRFPSVIPKAARIAKQKHLQFDTCFCMILVDEGA